MYGAFGIGCFHPAGGTTHRHAQLCLWHGLQGQMLLRQARIRP